MTDCPFVSVEVYTIHKGCNYLHACSKEEAGEVGGKDLQIILLK